MTTIEEEVSDYNSEMDSQFRADFLEEHGRKESDVLEDEDGEYIMVENDKDESKQFSKEYLPEPGEWKEHI